MDIDEAFTPPPEFINVISIHPGPSSVNITHSNQDQVNPLPINQLIKQELATDQSLQPPTVKTKPKKPRKSKFGPKAPPKTSTERSRECRARKSGIKVKKEKKRVKTTVERMREYRARQKLLRNQLKCFFYTSAPKPAPKTAAERSRDYRARKNSEVKLKKVPKTPAQLSREYRQRRKLMKNQLIWNLKSEDQLKQWLKQYQIDLPVPDGPLEEQEMNELIERLQQSQREEQETIKEESAEPSPYDHAQHDHTSTSECDTEPDLKPELSTTTFIPNLYGHAQHTSDTEPTNPEVKEELVPTESVYIDESFKFESINVPPIPDNTELIVPKVETVELDEIHTVKVEPEEIPELPDERPVEEDNGKLIVPKIELEEDSVFDQIWNFPTLIALPSPSWACHRVLTSNNQRFVTFMNAKITETNFIAETERQIIIRDSLQTTFVYENRIIRNMDVFKFDQASIGSIEGINRLLFEFAAFNQRLG